jgi:hypothetical protein
VETNIPGQSQPQRSELLLRFPYYVRKNGD